MSHIRIKNYKKRDGSISEKFELCYQGQSKKRCSKLFNTRREAEIEQTYVENKARASGRPLPRKTLRVIEGLRSWLLYMEQLQRAGKRERTTVDHYRTHIEYHVAKTDFAYLTLANIESFDVQKFIEYLECNLSTELARKVFQTLKTGLKYCRRNQWLYYLPTEDFRIQGRGREESGKIRIPAKADVKALLKAADQDITGINGAIVRVLCFCGLRPSEMRGLRRDNVFLDEVFPYLEVVQRADLYNEIGKPKSRAAYRKIPLGPDTVKAIRKAMFARKTGVHNVVFPNLVGEVMCYPNFVHRFWKAIMKRAGLVRTEIVGYKSNPGRKVEKIIPNFTPYTLRHIAASQWIEMNLLPKRIQTLMGHNDLKMTMDTYGHLWQDPEADNEIAINTERAFAQ
jgi:integrase